MPDYGHADALRHGSRIGNPHRFIARHNAGRTHHHPAVQGGSFFHRHASPQVIVSGLQLHFPLHRNLGSGGTGKLYCTKNLGRVFRERLFPMMDDRGLFPPYYSHGLNVGKLRRTRKIQIDSCQELRIKAAVRPDIQRKNGAARDTHHHRVNGRGHLHLRIHFHGNTGNKKQVVQLHSLVFRRSKPEHQGTRSGRNTGFYPGTKPARPDILAVINFLFSIRPYGHNGKFKRGLPGPSLRPGRKPDFPGRRILQVQFQFSILSAEHSQGGFSGFSPSSDFRHTVPAGHKAVFGGKRCKLATPGLLKAFLAENGGNRQAQCAQQAKPH